MPQFSAVHKSNNLFPIVVMLLISYATVFALLLVLASPQPNHHLQEDVRFRSLVSDATGHLAESKTEAEQYVTVRIRRCPTGQQKQAQERPFKMNKESFESLQSVQVWLANHQQALEYDKTYFPAAYSSLSFCVLAFTESAYKSLIQAQYPSVKIIVPPSLKSLTENNINSAVSSCEFSSIRQLNQTVKQSCKGSDVLLFAKEQVPANLFEQLNSLHQEKSAWVTFRRKDVFIQVFSFYRFLFDQAMKNDTAIDQLSGIEAGVALGVGLLQIGFFHKFQLDSQWKPFSFMALPQTLKIEEMAKNFQPLSKRNQQYLLKTNHISTNLQVNSPIDQNKLSSSQLSLLRSLKKQIAIEYQQLLYLPKGHALAERQVNKYQAEYQVGNQPKELPLCVTMMSYNNIQNTQHQHQPSPPPSPSVEQNPANT